MLKNHRLIFRVLVACRRQFVILPNRSLRLPKCDADAMDVEKGESLPAEVRQMLAPLLEQVQSVTEKIQQLDEEIEQIARRKYPETELLRQVKGVGVLIA